MQVRIQETPNPNALKFIRFLDPLSFPSAESAAHNPLASRIFATGRVYNVFMVQDFITVNKLPDFQWEGLQEEIVALIDEFVNSDISG
jgi:hypothetical protein